MFGGAFNPPHIGHLICAQEALVQLGLGRVVIVPYGQPPHRELEDDPGAEVRAQLCEVAVEGDERLAVSRAEVERPGVSYSVDTLAELAAGPASGHELVLILGGDRAAGLADWHQPERILELATVAVAEREGAGRGRAERALAGLGAANRVSFFDMPRIDVSSTLVRGRVSRGEPVRYLVPEGVRAEIERAGLYRGAAP